MQVAAMILPTLITLFGCGAAQSTAVPAMAAMNRAEGAIAVADEPAAATKQPPEKLVIEGSLTLVVEEIGTIIGDLRHQVEGAGGRVLTEVVSGAETSWHAELTVRVPPDKVEALLGWLASHGEITDKRITGTDVSKTLFDQEIALGNLQATLDRLRALLAQGGLSMQDILSIEREMTRLRGEIETIKGEKRFLEDRVALATLNLSFSSREGAVFGAKAKLHLGPRFASLILIDPEGRQRTRLGGGFSLQFGPAPVTLDLDVFEESSESTGADPTNAVVATFGSYLYSDFLGRGQRTFLNPHIGFRMGYGYLGGSSFVLQGEAGVELLKTSYALVDASARITGFIDTDGADTAVIAGATALFAF